MFTRYDTVPEWVKWLMLPVTLFQLLMLGVGVVRHFNCDTDVDTVMH